jgi:hypothetical protein
MLANTLNKQKIAFNSAVIRTFTQHQPYLKGYIDNMRKTRKGKKIIK